jgi:recombinational DNA repair protein (RecF pathway)
MATKRIGDEPAYVLHRYDWSESSLILEVFTRKYGRVALVARGAKKPSSSFRPILLPLQPLHIAFGGDAEIRTLKSAEWQGGHVMPTGDALLSGYYLNELLMRLMARDDPHPVLFDAYAATVQLIAAQSAETLQLALRAFELRCCATSACCRCWTPKPPRWRRWTRTPAMCWCPRRACGKRMTMTASACPAGNGRRCSRRWATKPCSPTLCGPVSPASMSLKRSCAACCTTIAA